MPFACHERNPTLFDVPVRWDPQRRGYIIYTAREVQESLCCAEHKAVKQFRELENIDVVQTAFEIFLMECSKNQKQAL